MRMRSITHGVIENFCEKTSGVCDCADDHASEQVCPQCQAVVPPRQREEQDRKLRVPLHYCAEGLALQCFLVFLRNRRETENEAE